MSEIYYSGYKKIFNKKYSILNRDNKWVMINIQKLVKKMFMNKQ